MTNMRQCEEPASSINHHGRLKNREEVEFWFSICCSCQQLDIPCLYAQILVKRTMILEIMIVVDRIKYREIIKRRSVRW